jgi:hypothetical protein
MSMLMLNMQSSIQMLPLLQQRQMQQKQNSMQFQTYISQMQALNSMLHTLSYGTPLSELNKLHSGVKNQFESYNNEVSSRLKGVINQVKDMNKATEIEREKLQHQLNDPEMRSEDDDEEFKDELDKLEEQVETRYRANKNPTLAASVGNAPDPSASSMPKTNTAFRKAANLSQTPIYTQPPQFYGSQPSQFPFPGGQPSFASPYVPFGYQWQYDPSSSKSTRKPEPKEKKRADSSSSSEKKKKKKKVKKQDSETESKVSALDSPREEAKKEKKKKEPQLNSMIPGMPNLEGMDPMTRNMMLLNMLNSLNEPDVRKKKKKKRKHSDEVLLLLSRIRTSLKSKSFIIRRTLPSPTWIR